VSFSSPFHEREKVEENLQITLGDLPQKCASVAGPDKERKARKEVEHLPYLKEGSHDSIIAVAS